MKYLHIRFLSLVVTLCLGIQVFDLDHYHLQRFQCMTEHFPFLMLQSQPAFSKSPRIHQEYIATLCMFSLSTICSSASLHIHVQNSWMHLSNGYPLQVQWNQAVVFFQKITLMSIASCYIVFKVFWQ